MRAFELGEIIAERKLTFEGTAGWSRDIVVRIGRPVQDLPDRAWVCCYQLVGLGRDRVMGIFGADSVQALLLAVHTIPAELIAFMKVPGGRFLHHGKVDDGFLTACRSTLEISSEVAAKVGQESDQPNHQHPAQYFLNVDLDVDSSDDLTPLVRALEPNAGSLERPPGRASFELNEPVSPTHPEPLILEFVRLVNALPADARSVWDGASRRVFDIGIQSARRPPRESHSLTSHTLRAVADVNAEIAVTVYALAPTPCGGTG